MSCLRDFDETITVEDLHAGNVAVLRKIYEAFLQLFSGVSKDDMGHMDYYGLTELSYPELHEDSVPEFTFFRNV